MGRAVGYYFRLRYHFRLRYTVRTCDIVRIAVLRHVTAVQNSVRFAGILIFLQMQFVTFKASGLVVDQVCEIIVLVVESFQLGVLQKAVNRQSLAVTQASGFCPCRAW